MGAKTQETKLFDLQKVSNFPEYYNTIFQILQNINQLLTADMVDDSIVESLYKILELESKTTINEILIQTKNEISK